MHTSKCRGTKKSQHNRSSASFTKGVSKDDSEYARELELWVFNNITTSLDQRFASVISNAIARDAARAAKHRYLQLARRDMESR